MSRRKVFIQKLHKEKPFVEPVFLFIMTTTLGFFLSMYASFLTEIQSNTLWESWYLWLAVFLLISIVLYYVFFSTYAFRHREARGRASQGKTDLLKVYLATTKNHLKEGNTDSFDRSSHIFVNAIDNINKMERGGKQI